MDQLQTTPRRLLADPPTLSLSLSYMSSSIYNVKSFVPLSNIISYISFSLSLFFFSQHKHLQPTGAATQGPSQQQHSQNRLNDCFDTIRTEFDALAQELVLYRNQRDDFENKGLSTFYLLISIMNMVVN